MEYSLKLSEEQLKDLLFVVDHVMFLEADRFKKWCAEGKDSEHHIYNKAVKSLAKLEAIL